MNRYKNGIFCFSPPVMLATFFVELFLALFTLWRYRLTAVSRLVVALLLLLAAFQMAEFMVCQAIGLEPLVWSRIGYIAITLLPPLGIHLAYELAGAKKRPLLAPAYASAAAFVVFFSLIGNALGAQACLGNYVIFEILPGSSWLYTLYYYGWLVGALVLCYRLARQVNAKKRHWLVLLGAGYCAFIVPTTAANIIDPGTIAGIPSIMCGFAVLLAFVLSFGIMPRAGVRK